MERGSLLPLEQVEQSLFGKFYGSALLHMPL